VISMLNILAFDTATQACSVALQAGDSTYSYFEISPQKHAEVILPMIQSVLADAKLDREKLTAIAFGNGPGSFMGVRLATATAQGLAFGLHIPVIEISTLQVLAQTAFEKTGARAIAAAWDARMHELYWNYFLADEHEIMQPQNNDQVTAPCAIDITRIDQLDCMLAGNAWAVYKDQLPAAFANKLQLTDIYPDARAMLTIAVSNYLANAAILPAAAKPHYVRHRVVQHHNHS